MENNFRKIKCSNMIRPIILGLLVGFMSCAKNSSSKLLYFEKDLIPEGIAIDPTSKKMFLNSLHKSKIVSCDLNGQNPKVFLESNQYGYLPGFGITIVQDTLYALGNTHEKQNNRSILLLLDVVSGNLIRRYSMASLKRTYLNDIVVGRKGHSFISESEGSSIYSINNKSQHFEVFFSDENIAHTNGITISDDGRFLYLATYASGLRVLDIATKKLINQPNDYKGIDGLKFYKNNLVAIVNTRKDSEKNGVFQFKLNQECSEIIASSKFVPLEDPSDIPTTFAIYDGYMYFVADSQMDLFDDTTNRITDSTKLEAYRLIRERIDN